ncbi:MAG: endonuclease/exonuclease/phosphatase family protein [Chloroflexi bacterium]|nr:endonuclease/exonuclease/phosphatase family protein [Chloroflexota bacterium]MCC6892515.1 endonuclease/exonuclease/phosphatase family protein [Anaerolineae bacterium]
MTLRKPTLGGIIASLFALYGLLLCIMLVLRQVGDGHSVLISAITVSLTVLLMPTLLFFPVSLLMKRWLAATFLAPPFAFFLLTYLPLFLPRPIETPPEAAPRLTLLTYNLHAEKTQLAPMTDVVRLANADIVAFQEMSSEASATLDTDLADLYLYRALYPAPENNPYHGRGLLSRYPITEAYSWPVEYPIPVRLMRAVIDVNGTPVVIYNFHAPPSTPIYGQPLDFHPRGQQIADVLAMIAEERGALIWMGDFNTTDTDVNYPKIVAQLQDTYREVGWGMGFTNPDWSFPQAREGLPFIPIHQRPDYIFHNSYFLPLAASVWPASGGSDHRAVLAALALVSPS